MRYRQAGRVGALAAATASALALVAGPALASSGPRVSVRVEGVSRTLLAAEHLRASTVSAHRQGHPVLGDTALGALNSATHGHWRGIWDQTFGWGVIGILGETHGFHSRYFWAEFVNHRFASNGPGEQRLRAGDHLLFAALPDRDANERLLGARAPRTATIHRPFRLRVYDYDAAGRARALRGATVSYGGRHVRARGTAVTVRPGRTGRLTLRVAKRGYVRTEVTVRVHR